MATPPASYIPWRRYKDALGWWALEALGFDPESDFDVDANPVLWADQGEERPGLPYLELLVVGGPSRRGGQDHRRPPEQALATQIVTVLPSAVAAAGDALRLRACGELFERSAEAGDAVEDARDALLALVQASVQPGYTAAASGGASILLTAERVGSLWGVEALAGCELGASTSALAELVVGKRELKIRATCYGAPDADDADPSPAEWVGMLQDAAASPAARERLRGQGLVITRVDAVQQRVSALSGPERENRAALELTLAFSVVRGTALASWVDAVTVTPIAP
jgi:hypothetical protein